MVLNKPVACKIGAHMVTFISYFDVEPQELNNGYYDGADNTYDVLIRCLQSEYESLGLDLPDFNTTIEKVARISRLNVPATAIVQCVDKGLYRLTFNPETGLCYGERFWGPYLIDETRYIEKAGMLQHLERKHREAQDRVMQLLDPTNTQVGVDTLTDYFHSIK